ncbi:MAG: PQQ-dependent sugar dehydrogenase [Candidatus Caldarchaeum sp.]|uniref:PQQ-dependent sugar dehydrogenase n=1 Tax=Caldiarchaeum subterraneum TaxID=311458 RepID=A0A7C5Q7L0_CALS0
MRLSRRYLLLGAASAGAAMAAAYLFPRSVEKQAAVDVEVVAKNLRVPWSISFISADEALFTERNGSVKLLTLSSRRVEQVGFVEVAAVGEGGLLGLETVKERRRTDVYLYHTYNAGGRLMNKVVRVTYDGGLEDKTDLVTNIPGGAVHDGGRIKLGPDNMLYITTGDGGQANRAQDLGSLGGKILRMTLDGKVPNDNPFKSLVYAYGLRNPQGIAWRESSNTMFCTDHGPTGEGARFAHDEVNIVVSGGNYGWPTVIGDEAGPGFIKPVLHSGLETWAPSGCCFYSSGEISQWNGGFFFATLRGQHLHCIIFNEKNNVVMHFKLFEGVFGRLRDVVAGPDSALYILTSNRDGRGSPAVEDDRILRVSSRS